VAYTAQTGHNITGIHMLHVGILQCGSVTFTPFSLAGIHDWIAQVTREAPAWRRLEEVTSLGAVVRMRHALAHSSNSSSYLRKGC
jgi:hypothetical protein